MSSFFKCFAAGLVLMLASQATAAEKLSDVLRKAKWDGIVGTWGDAETGGENYRLTHEWKFKDRVMEVTSKEQSKESVTLMGVDGKKGTVFLMGADNLGTSFIGDVKFEDNGDAVQGILFTGPSGEQGAFSIRYHWEDKDTITLTIQLPVEVKMKLVRLKLAK